MNDSMTSMQRPEHATPMKARPVREIFGLYVRFAGLLSAIYGFYCVTFAIAAFSSAGGQRYPGSTYLFFGVAFGGLGAALLRGGWLIRFAYGSNDT